MPSYKIVLHVTRILEGFVGLIHVLSFVNCNDVLTMNTFEYGSKTSAMLDHVCPTVELIKSTYAANHVRCSILCQQESSCLSFFYDRGTQGCVLCSGLYYGTSGLDIHQGMEYYRMVSPWEPWSTWSTCSNTCGGGTKIRIRTCSPDAPDFCMDKTETTICNAYSCTPIEKTCADWASLGLDGSAIVQIDPLGTGPVEVVCNLTMEPGKVWTVMGHNFEERTYVHGYEAPFSYHISIEYDIGLEAAIKVVDMSTECKQYVKWECYHQQIEATSYWENRDGNRSTYFTGSPPPGKYCACGDTGTCSDTSLDCECTRNDFVWRVHEGFVTIKGDLPITGIKAGDTGDSQEKVYHTFRPLMCV